MYQPKLQTARLLLRPFALDDAAAVQRLAGDRAIADTTLNVPHPYEDGMAEEWISGHRGLFEGGVGVIFAIVQKESGVLVGAASLRLEQSKKEGELGYWVGQSDWGQGYATEAAEAIVAYGFRELQLDRISAKHLVRNPASGRVMEKIGMRREGTVRQEMRKSGSFEDMHVYGMVSSRTFGADAE